MSEKRNSENQDDDRQDRGGEVTRSESTTDVEGPAVETETSTTDLEEDNSQIQSKVNLRFPGASEKVCVFLFARIPKHLFRFFRQFVNYCCC